MFFLFVELRITNYGYDEKNFLFLLGWKIAVLLLLYRLQMEVLSICKRDFFVWE